MREGGWVLGVDEHTGLILDMDAGTATVMGNGSVTVRRQGASAVLGSGEAIPIHELSGLPSGKISSAAAAEPERQVPAGAPRTALHGEIRRLESQFDKAVESGDVDSAVGCVLELLDTLDAWAGDTTQSDAGERGQAAVRRMVVRLGSLAAVGARDPRKVVGMFVEGLLEAREAARAEGRYEYADKIRQLLMSAGVEVRDSRGGSEWRLVESS